MDNPLEQPAPEDPIDRVHAFARDLAWGAVNGKWVGVFSSWSFAVKDVIDPDKYHHASNELILYIQGKWCSEPPGIDLLMSLEYFTVTQESLAPQGNIRRISGPSYRLTPKAFALLEKPPRSPVRLCRTGMETCMENPLEQPVPEDRIGRVQSMPFEGLSDVFATSDLIASRLAEIQNSALDTTLLASPLVDRLGDAFATSDLMTSRLAEIQNSALDTTLLVSPLVDRLGDAFATSDLIASRLAEIQKSALDTTLLASPLVDRLSDLFATSDLMTSRLAEIQKSALDTTLLASPLVDRLGDAFAASDLVASRLAEIQNSELDTTLLASPLVDHLSDLFATSDLIAARLAEFQHPALDETLLASPLVGHLTDVFAASDLITSPLTEFQHPALDETLLASPLVDHLTDVFATYDLITSPLTEFQHPALHKTLFASALADFGHVLPEFPESILPMENSLLSVRNMPPISFAFPELYEPISPLFGEVEVVGELLSKGGVFFWKMLPITTVLSLYRAHRAASVINEPVTTEVLLDFTLSEDFATRLECDFQEFPLLRRRWHNIKEALEGHKKGLYSLSVRSLLPEIEGILSDVLDAEGHVCIEGDKVYRVTENSKSELKGLGQVAREAHRSILQEDEDFQKFRKFLVKKLAGSRHSILHGRDIEFGTASFSVKLLICVRGLAAVIVRHAESIGN